MKQNIIETILGAVVIVVAGVFLYFAYNTANLQKVDGYIVEAEFSTIEGLKVGGDIRISGVKIGSIVGLDLNPDNFLARASLSIDPSIKLPLDTVAIVTSEGLLGGKYLELQPGGDEELLENGDMIEYTQASPSLEKLIGQVLFSMDGQDKADKSNTQN